MDHATLELPGRTLMTAPFWIEPQDAEPGDPVRVTDGVFEGFEGHLKGICGGTIAVVRSGDPEAWEEYERRGGR